MPNILLPRRDKYGRSDKVNAPENQNGSFRMAAAGQAQLAWICQ